MNGDRLPRRKKALTPGLARRRENRATSPFARSLRVGDVMSSPALVAPPNATLERIVEIMLEHRAGSVVIVDTGDLDRVVGIVTETDFDVADEPIPLTAFRWPKLLGEHVWSERSLEHVYALARTQAAESIMSSPVHTVDAEAEIWEAVNVMVAHDVKRLPVLSAGRLVGVISRHDLLKCLVSQRARAGRG
jgi:CBS domain-containing protein